MRKLSKGSIVQMKKKILIVASSYHFIRTFLEPHIKHLSDNGWTVHVSSDDDMSGIRHADDYVNIPIRRSPFHVDNLKAVEVLQERIVQEQYDVVHCHTPIGAMVARLAAKKARRTSGTKVIYTTHGLHFYKGAPVQYWLLFFTAEKLLARYTDVIITINDEDEKSAARYFPEIKQQYRISGIGYDKSHICRGDATQSERALLRQKHGYGTDDFVCLYIAEFIDRKNHRFLLSHLPEVLRRIPDIKYLFLGQGEKMEQCREMVSCMNMQDRVQFAGYHTDLSEYMRIADIGVSSSRTEGLGLGLIEELYMSLPVVATDVRGHGDFMEHGKNGYLYKLDDFEGYVSALERLYRDPALRKTMGEYASQSIARYDVNHVLTQIDEIYKNIL